MANTMYRGTTPSISFRVTSQFDFTMIQEIWITVSTWQTEKTYKYSENQVAIDELAKTISISMTQEDTLAFGQGTLQVQMRLLDTENNAYATEIYNVQMNQVLKGGVISG